MWIISLRGKLVVLGLILALVGGYILFKPIKAERGSIEPIQAYLVLIQSNTLVAISPPTQPFSISVLATKIVDCESGGKQTAIGKAGEIGIAQFKPGTWTWMSDLASFNGSINNSDDQLYLLQWGLDNGYENHWTCFSLLGLVK